MNEEWRDINIDNGKYVGRYQVSNMGRVRSHPNSKITGSKPGKILFQSCDNRGYSQVYLYFKYKQTTTKVHRLVVEAFLPKRGHGWQVNHLDGDKTNNRLSNLELCTNKENQRHATKFIRGNGIVVFGAMLTIGEAVEKHGAPGVTEQSARRRMVRYGWTPEQAITTPIGPTGRPSREAIKSREEQSEAWRTG